MKITIIQKSDIKISNKIINNIKKILKLSIKTLKNNKYDSLSIIFINSSDIKKLNKNYLNKNCITDVLSFKNEIPIKNSLKSGEIIICPQIAIKNSKKYQISLEKEIIELSIHGLIHLYDFDHKNKRDLLKWNNIYKKIKNIVK